MSVTPRSAQDLIFGARNDRRVRLERQHMKHPARQPHYHPTSPPTCTPLPGKVKQAFRYAARPAMDRTGAHAIRCQSDWALGP